MCNFTLNVHLRCAFNSRTNENIRVNVDTQQNIGKTSELSIYLHVAFSEASICPRVNFSEACSFGTGGRCVFDDNYTNAELVVQPRLTA